MRETGWSAELECLQAAFEGSLLGLDLCPVRRSATVPGLVPRPLLPQRRSLFLDHHRLLHHFLLTLGGGGFLRKGLCTCVLREFVETGLPLYKGLVDLGEGRSRPDCHIQLSVVTKLPVFFGILSPFFLLLLPKEIKLIGRPTTDHFPLLHRLPSQRVLLRTPTTPTTAKLGSQFVLQLLS